ncbi:Oidioi.mRNA.OKI2018_I69.PAR.g9873.t1.cds [Oikopleura dioica]|uniref:Oidioi.mRNA.OKI2018_I69.PAR.g9873.t1.cds n=1 Tax=Oikopleura dioica TaxID=34765 RepID=A0ABN7RRB4_OIKDI|nr:Oidioi.mRNA.OKI2018_I69.PAR.g9873.t1.cds [Oikopleura dioica]
MKIASSLLSSLVVTVASQGAIFFAPDSPDVRARAPSSGGFPSQNRPTMQQRPTQRPFGQRPVGQRPVSQTQNRPPVQNRPQQQNRPTTRPTPRPTTRATTKKTTTTEEPTTTTFTTTTTVEDTTLEKIQEVVVDEAGEEGPGEGERMWGNYNNNNYNNQYNQQNYNQPSQNYNQNNNYDAGAGGYAQADPHFMVETLGQPPICFDYDPETLDDLVLFSDPSGLSLVAQMFENEKGHKFIKSVNIRSPEGESITISAENGLETEVKDMEESGEGFVVGDLKIKSNWNGVHEHTRVHIHGGPAFAIISNTIKRNLEVSVEHGQVEEFDKVKGIIGAFMNNNAYVVVPKEDGTASVLIGGEEFAAVEERYHLTPKCWVLDTTDALNILQLV